MNRTLLLVALLTATLVAIPGADADPESDGPEFAATYERFAVAADHPAASQAGAEVLAAGGSAADAAAATMLALGVANPASSGMGGGGFALYWDAEAEKLTYLDFREEAPAAATADMFHDAEERSGEGPLSQPSQLGGLASGVPGEPAGIAELLKRFGRLPRKKVVAPALRLAEDGATVSPALARMSKYFAAQMKKDPVMTKWFEPGADALRAGATFRQPELARTLRAFARKGRDAIYEGRIARAIARSNKRAGGVMTVEDLAAYEVVEREPMMAERFGHRWATAPPPSAGGFTMLQSLALLERWAPRWKASEAARLHALAESWKGPFMDRQVFVGDPDHVDVPLDAMMASTRMDRRAAVFHPALALPPDDYELPIDGHPEHDAVQPEGGGTSHLCVVDEDGNVASVTTTVNLPFGARYTAAGMVMNDEMDDFAREVGKKNAFGLPGGAPNLPGPSRRPVSTMSPTIVFDEAGPVLCVGAAGGSRIVTATEQVAFNVVVSGMSVADALLHPRVHHQGKPNQLRTEETHPLGREVVDALKARGHEHEHIDHAAVVQAIRIVRDGDEVTLQAGSDPRKGGLPAGQ